MVPIARKIAGKTREFVIFTKGEADERGLSYKPWREAGPGDFALTDDGYVAECLSTSFVGKRRYSHFSCGKVFHNPGARLIFEDRLRTRSFSRFSSRGWVEAEAARTRTKNLVSAYVKMVLGSGGAVDFERLGQIYRPDQKTPPATVKRLLRQGKIKEMIQEEMRNELKETGITKAWILERFKRAIDLAEKTENPNAIIHGAKELAAMQEMYPEKGHSPVMLEFGVTADISKSLEAAQKELSDVKSPVEGTFEVVEPTGTEETV